MGGKVTGIGGVSFKTDDPDAMRRWYKDKLGLDAGEWGATYFWRERENENVGYTVWSTFKTSSDYFEPSRERRHTRAGPADRGVGQVLLGEGGPGDVQGYF